MNVFWVYMPFKPDELKNQKLTSLFQLLCQGRNIQWHSIRLRRFNDKVLQA